MLPMYRQLEFVRAQLVSVLVYRSLNTLAIFVIKTMDIILFTQWLDRINFNRELNLWRVS